VQSEDWAIKPIMAKTVSRENVCNDNKEGLFFCFCLSFLSPELVQ
jgi:hypothetical protein